MIEIRRESLLNELKRQSISSSVLITGSPGAGKSWLLRQLLEYCVAEDRFVIGFAAEDYQVNSLPELYKSMGLAKTIPELLRAQEGSPLLVLDGLDALRSEPTQRVLRELMYEVFERCPSARVIATIRSFDLRESPTYSQLMRYQGTSAPFAEIKVGLLSENEMRQVSDAEIGFAAVWAGASSTTRELLRNPFNLQLALALLATGTQSLALQSIGSQTELLERYWEHRIDASVGSASIKGLLRVITEKMIESRLLSVPQAATVPSGYDSSLQQLLSMELLRTNATGRLGFTHNIFFDYSMARVVLDEVSVAPFVTEEPSRSLYYRPSLHFFFAHIWLADRNMFWRIVNSFYQDRELPQSAKIVPAIVIAELAHARDELAFLLDEAEDSQLLGHVLNAIQVLGLATRRELWLGFLADLSVRPQIGVINQVFGLCDALAMNSSGGERIRLGTAARRFIEWSWNPGASVPESSQEQLSSVVTGRLLPQAVADVAENNEEVRAFVRGLLERIGGRNVSTSEIGRLTHVMKAIVECDAALTAEIYEALYRYVERSEETTHLGSGTVLNMTSTRKQDYSGSRYMAAQYFSKFLQHSPVLAARTAVKATNWEVLQERPLNNEDELKELSFEAGGKQFSYIPDYSEIWGNTGRDYTSLSLLDSSIRFLLEQDEELIEQMTQEMLAAASVAVVWRRMLEAAVRHPEMLYPHVRLLLESPRFISAPEVSIEAGRLLAAASKAGIISRENFMKIEAAIMNITEEQAVLRYENIPTLQKRLLCSVNRSLLSTEAALAVANSHEEPRENVPYFTMGSFGAIPEEQAMRLEGVDPDANENRLLLDTLQPVERFNEQHRNKEVDAKAAEAAFEPMQALKRILESPEQLGAAREIRLRARGALIEAAGTALRVRELDRSSQLFALCRELAISGASDENPVFNARYHLPFDDPGWGGPSPRIDAAFAIGMLVSNHVQDEQVMEIFERLSEDRVPAVRFQVARVLPGLFNGANLRDQFWKILEKMLAAEDTNGVLTGLLSSLRSVARHEPERAVRILHKLLEKGVPHSKRSDSSSLIIDMLVGLYVVLENSEARGELSRFERDVQSFESDLCQIALTAFQYISPADATDPALRARAQELLVAVNQAARSYAALEWAKPAGQRQMAPPARVLDTLASRFYFAFDLMGTRAPFQHEMNDAQREQLYGETRELLTSVAQASDQQAVIPLVPQAAHYLLQLLNGILWISPEDALINAAAVCRHGSLTGYLMDSLARGEAVKLVEKAFADHRELLQKREVSDAVRAMLDLFIQAGWTEAITLSFRLDEAFR